MYKRQYLKGEKTSTNPMATIFAWSGALKKRGELDGLPELGRFGEALEAASRQTLNDGIMTKDLCGLAEGITPTAVDSEGFILSLIHISRSRATTRKLLQQPSRSS